ncbi:MAG: hypothetical protein ACYC91_09530 [Solirubrobacteraceae bacterium]
MLIAEAAHLDKALAAIAQVDSVEQLVLLDGSAEEVVHLDELEDAEPPAGFDFETTWRAVQPEDILTLIHTSGRLDRRRASS